MVCEDRLGVGVVEFFPSLTVTEPRTCNSKTFLLQMDCLKSQTELASHRLTPGSLSKPIRHRRRLNPRHPKVHHRS